MTQVSEHIWFIDELDSANPDLVDYLPGYYFADESEQLQGPFGTASDAVEAMEVYARSL